MFLLEHKIDIACKNMIVHSGNWQIRNYVIIINMETQVNFIPL